MDDEEEAALGASLVAAGASTGLVLACNCRRGRLFGPSSPRVEKCFKRNEWMPKYKIV